MVSVIGVTTDCCIVNQCTKHALNNYDAGSDRNEDSVALMDSMQGHTVTRRKVIFHLQAPGGVSWNLILHVKGTATELPPTPSPRGTVTKMKSGEVMTTTGRWVQPL